MNQYRDSHALLSTGTYHFACDSTDSADAQWNFFAPKIAGRNTYRWMNAEGKYLPSNERPIGQESPARPAAVMIYSAEGQAQTICLDFDAKFPSLEDDLEECRTWLDSFNILYVVDRSISGGHHIYIPLNETLNCIDARFFVEHLATHWASLDASPHRVAKHGCIRVPGSRHKNGGSQTLITDFDRSVMIFTVRNTAESINQLLDIAVHCSVNRAVVREATPASPAPAQPTVKSATRIKPKTSLARAIAEGAPFDGSYASPSEARMAVICSLVSSGWDIHQIDNEMSSGRLPGLAALYSKYSTDAKRTRLQAEILKAEAFVEKRHVSKGYPPVRKNNINDTFNSQRGDIHRKIRQMRALIDLFDQRLSRKRSGIYLRVLLRALFEFAHKTGQTRFAVGCRALAIATGMHFATVSKLLKELVQVPGAPVVKIKKGYLGEADEYELRLEAADQLVAKDHRLAKGKIYSIRPVFRALGPVAALVYESIEETPHQSRKDLARSTGLSATAVYEALKEMSSLGMVYLDHGVWRIRISANLRQLANMLGVLDEMAEQISRYRAERKAWHEYLARVPGSRYYLAPVNEREIFDPVTEEAVVGPPPPKYRPEEDFRPLDEHELYDAEMDYFWVHPGMESEASLVDISLLRPYERVAA